MRGACRRVDHGSSKGDLHMLPVMEYIFPAGSTVRSPTNTLGLDAHGNTIDFFKKTQRRLPADDSTSPMLLRKLRRMACEAHRTLGCTDYSIYDVMIDPSDEVFMLDSCLYYSFFNCSALMLMAGARGDVDPRRLFDNIADGSVGGRRVGAQQRTLQQMIKGGKKKRR